MTFPILVDFALKNAGKYIAKNFGLKVLNSKGAHNLNTREDYAINAYRDKSGKLYKNKNLIKEYYNSDLPIDKKVSKWNEKDLINAVNSPLYKYDKNLQSMAKNYIKKRAKHRYNGLK